MAHGVIGEANVLGDLIGLCKSDIVGRTSTDEITMFISVGTAIEDWAAAVLAYETTTDRAN
jgi:ornithine cyclodeaminase